MKDHYKRAALLAVFMLCLVVRVWGLADNATFRGDEGFQVPAAVNYVETGHREPDNWIHPPLKSILLYANMKIWGNNPYGWRMLNVLLGSLSVIILYLLAREMFEDRRIAVFAGMFLALDPLHIFFSRSNFQEIPAACFFLIGVYFTLRHLKGSLRASIVAGFFIGLAHAMKWYYVPAWILVVCYVVYLHSRCPEWSVTKALFVASAFVALPIAIYILTYYAWFERGYGLIEFFQMHVDMFREIQAMRLDGFKIQLAEIGPPVLWFLKPMYYAFPLDVEGSWPRVLVIMNNPPVWMLVLPSAAYAIYRSFLLKEEGVILLLGIFMAIYPQFLLTGRPVFLYSAITVLPFAVLLVAYALSSLIRRMTDGRSATVIVVTIFLIWSSIVYLLATGMPSPPGFASLFLG